MPLKRPDPVAIDRAIDRSTKLLERTQGPDGAWPGDYGGPMFLLPLFVATTTIIGESLSAEERAEMVRYIRGKQNPDGGFGLHVEGPSTVYGTCANYVALRLLGEPADRGDLIRARQFLHDHGGPVRSAAWGKFMLALLDLYPYEALDPVPPELWLLPESAPLHPSRLWCHCRMVYLPMSYLYGRRCRAASTPLLEQLRQELYPVPYEEVNWQQARGLVAEPDNLVPTSKLARTAHQLLHRVEGRWTTSYRTKALNFVLHQIEREDQNTEYICIGPINKLLNTLVWFFEDPTGPELERHVPRLRDYLYQAPDGLKMQGYNSSKLWDATFAVQALAAAGRLTAGKMTSGVHNYVESNQVLSDVRDHESAYRHPSKGGWPFSNRAHGWPISDCTAEGIKASLCLADVVDQPLPPARLKQAAQLILSLQNADGGWATYEKKRGPDWLELLNPANCFRDIMIDYSYVECTSACVQALTWLEAQQPDASPAGIAGSVSRGRDFILGKQRPDGSFYGSWGVCFTYGTWFGVTGLRAAGLDANHSAIRKARAFLESKQRPDGGWGESIRNCVTKTYDDGTESQVVMTSWSLLALLECGALGTTPVEQAVQFLLDRQGEDGSYPDENVAGVFNGTCAIHYDNYLKVFPLWALGRYYTLRSQLPERHGANSLTPQQSRRSGGGS